MTETSMLKITDYPTYCFVTPAFVAALTSAEVLALVAGAVPADSMTGVTFDFTSDLIFPFASEAVCRAACVFPSTLETVFSAEQTA